MAEKQCAKCGWHRHIGEFAKRGAGFQAYCKGCNREYWREWAKSNGRERRVMKERAKIAGIIGFCEMRGMKMSAVVEEYLEGIK